MRLTLRTLLAYLDDLLEPEQSREIGEKISESGYASALVDRIREVMRRRRLTAPDPRSPNSGLDTNAIAEYLDNTLDPEAVADVEKVCLDSDVHLAEVAASHQILTLVLGEPVDVPAKTRERMYALGPDTKPEGSNGRLAVEGDSSNGSDSSSSVPAKPASSDEGASEESFNSTIPDYLKPVPIWRRMAPIAVGVIVGGIWLALVYFDPTSPLSFLSGSNNGSTVAQIDSQNALGNEPGTADGVTSTAPENKAGTGQETVTGGNGQTPESQSGQETVNSRRTPRSISELNGFDPDEPSDTSASTAVLDKPETLVAGTAPQPVAPALPEPTVPATGTTVAAATTPATSGSSVTAPSTIGPVTAPAPADGSTNSETIATPSVPAPEVLYTSREGILARESDKGWLAMPHRTVVRAGDRIASLEPYSALLEVSSLNLLIELQGGCVIEFLGATENEPLSLRLLTGRLSVQRQSSAENAEPVAVALQLLDEPCRLTLDSASALCGVELTPTAATSYEKSPGANRYTGNLFVVDGRVGFSDKLAGESMLTEPSWFPLTPEDRRAMADNDDRPPLLTVPEWLDPNSSRMSSTRRRYASRFQKEVDEELPLRDSIPSIVKSKIPGISELAVKTMDVTGMHDLLVQVMAEAEFLEAREAAITGLRRWLPAATENREILRAKLQQHFPADDVDTLYRLLWGYNQDDARNPATSSLLVGWLAHDNQVIRQLAFEHIYRLTGQRYDYRPINPPNQRKVAVDRWHSHLDRNNGALIE